MKERMFFIMAIFPERINVVTLYDDNNNAVQLEKFYLILLADLDAEDANEGKWVVLEGRQSVINYLSGEFYNGIDPLKSYILTGNIRLGNEVSVYSFLRAMLNRPDVETSISLDESDEYVSSVHKNVDLNALFIKETRSKN